METVSVPPPLERHLLPELKHSGLGIASFVLSMTVGLVVFVLIAIAGYQEMKTPGGMDENAPETMLLGLLMMGALLLNLVGVALGIAGVVQKDRKKIFGVLGLTFNLVVVLGTLGLMFVGSTME